MNKGPRTAAAAPPQTKTSAARPRPTPPPVYRPQPLQKCLQPKRHAGLQPPQAPTRPSAPRPARPQPPPPPPAPTRPSASAAQAKPHTPPGARAGQTNSPLVLQRTKAKPSTSIQAKPAASRVVQAIKLYPNLHPGAVESIEPGNVYKLSSFSDQYRLRKTQSHGVYVPNQLYNFVRTSEGEMLLHNRYRHPSIAEGRQVLYAGEAYFNNGKLEWWSNGSGHYQPDSEDAQQAALPMDYFYSYQQVIKGEHKRKRA
jgi:hypothetical protein